MTPERRREIKLKAQVIRRELGLNDVEPIGDIVKLCISKYDFSIKFVSFSNQLKGKHTNKLDALARLSPESRKPQVVINQDSHNYINKVRFTVAHELGHFILGHLEDDSIAARGESIDLASNKEKEIEANYFAAEFLLPEIVASMNVNTKELAEMYTVSEYVVLYRKNNVR